MTQLFLHGLLAFQFEKPTIGGIMAVSRHIDVSKLKWVQWENRHGETKAHAIDPGAEERTGKIRTLTGSLIPDGAVPAKADTVRDQFSVQVIERIQAQQAESEAKEEAKSAAKQAKAEAEEVKKAAKQAAEEVKKAARAAAAEEKAKAKAAASEQKSVEKAATVEKAAAKQGLRRKGEAFEVLHGGKVIGTFPVKSLDMSLGAPSISVTDKVWVVSQKGKKIAQGKLIAAAA